MFGRSTAPAATPQDDGLLDGRRSAFNILPGGGLPTRTPVSVPVPAPVQPPTGAAGSAENADPDAPPPADERTLDAMEALEGFAFRSTGLTPPPAAAPAVTAVPAVPEAASVAETAPEPVAEPVVDAPVDSVEHASTAVLVPADEKPAKGRLRPAFGLRRRRDSGKAAPAPVVDATNDAIADVAEPALPTPPPYDPAVHQTPLDVPSAPPMEAVADLPSAPDFVPAGLDLPPAYDGSFAADRFDTADMVDTDPTAPYVEGDLVDDEPAAVLPPPFAGAIAVPSFAPAMPAQLSFPPVADDVVSRVAAQVSAQYEQRAEAMEQAHEARQADETWPQEAPAPQVQGFGATVLDTGPDTDVLSGLAPEHLLEPSPVQTWLEPTAEAAAVASGPTADEVAPLAPSSGLVFADGTVADLGASPELAALQQAAFALTDPQENDGRR
jgi:hypothetical protein